jgi:hypothetical protein
MGSTIERALGVIAAIITIANFVVTLPALQTGSIADLPSIAQNMVLPTRFVITVILEGALAFFFGLAMAKAASVSMSLGSISAWISFFNLEYILLGTVVATIGKYVLLFFLGIAAFVVSALLIWFHMDEEGVSDDPIIGAVIAQGICFLIIFALVIIQRTNT